MWSVFRKHQPYEARALVVEDAQACADLHKAAFQQSWTTAEFENLIAARNTRSDGCTSSSGSALLAFIISRIVADEAEILTIATAPTERRRGLATVLLQDHLETLRHCGVHKLFLEVSANNTAALALYQKFGFGKIGERPAYYSMPNGERALAHTMMRAL